MLQLGTVIAGKLFIDDPSFKLTFAEIFSFGGSKAVGWGFKKLAKYISNATDIEKWIFDQISDFCGDIIETLLI